MEKRIGKIVCPWCGSFNDVLSEDLGFEEFECGDCEYVFSVPEDPADLTEVSAENSAEAGKHNTATHVRIMVRGEDGAVFCVKNSVEKDNDLLHLALAGVEAMYPEGRVFVEDEEATSLGYMRNLLFDLA